VSLPDVTVVTNLGVLVDNNLRFTKHYRLIVNRSSRILKSFQSRNSQLLFKAFTVFVRPLLDYCSPVWAPVYLFIMTIVHNRTDKHNDKRKLN